MSAEALAEQFRSKITMYELDDGSFSFCSPFIYGDGDGLPIVLEHVDEGWRLTDRGGAASHLFFDDIKLTAKRLAFIRRVAEIDGYLMSEHYELSTEPQAEMPNAFDVADFIQGVAMIRAVLAL